MTREEAIDVIRWMIVNWVDSEDKHKALIMAIKALEQPEQRWIPVSERLPKVDESVLATTVWNDVTTAWRIGVDKWFIYDGGTNATTEDLIAWIPMPEPYGGEQE